MTLEQAENLRREMRPFTGYPAVYHAAVNHLVAFGGHNNAAEGRRLCAAALRALRARYGREFAARERWHMIFISGQMPVKAVTHGR